MPVGHYNNTLLYTLCTSNFLERVEKNQLKKKTRKKEEEKREKKEEKNVRKE